MDELSEQAKAFINGPDGPAFVEALKAASEKAIGKCWSEALEYKASVLGDPTPLTDAELVGVLGRIRSEMILDMKEQGWSI